MKLQWRLYGPLRLCFLLRRGRSRADDTLEEIVVTATLRRTSMAELPQSVTVLDAETLHAAGVQHSRTYWV